MSSIIVREVHHREAEKAGGSMSAIEVASSHTSYLSTKNQSTSISSKRFVKSRSERLVTDTATQVSSWASR
jgi:hypothetical protein